MEVKVNTMTDTPSKIPDIAMQIPHPFAEDPSYALAGLILADPRLG
jgi:hypothetical protein